MTCIKLVVEAFLESCRVCLSNMLLWHVILLKTKASCLFKEGFSSILQMASRSSSNHRLSRSTMTNPPNQWDILIFWFPLHIRYESDDVIWLRNHAYTWILVPNIGCKQTMASNTCGPLTFFGVHTFSFSDYPKAIRSGEILFKSNHVILRLPIAE